MSSNIPTRRVTRTTRAAAVKENENANARPSRISTRSKPLGLSSTTAGLTGATGGVTRATAASRAKASVTATDSKLENLAGKRKREALGEVAVASNNKQTGGASKGKEKETYDGMMIKGKGVATRQPLRTVASTRQETHAVTKKDSTSTVHAKSKHDSAAVVDANAMVVDVPNHGQVQLPKLAVRRSTVIKESQITAVRRPDSQRRASLRSGRRIVEEEEPAHKKRRTSSVPPEEEPEAVADARAQTEEDLHHARLLAEIEAFAEEPEADPENSPWDDLDAEDSEDPLMVSEYVQDIFQYLKQVELTTMPNPNYMENQKELAWKMRGILTDWLIQVHVRFRLLPETLFLCVNIIDRFLSARVVSLAKLQLVGVTCMFIAAKFEEVVAPSVSHFLMCADSSYTEAEILQAERYVLKILEWNLSYPNPVHYLRRISKADDYNVKVRTLGKYLLEIGVLEWRLIAAPPSLMAAAAIWLARLALGMEQWTPNLAHFSSYRESALIPTANLMLNYILKPIRHESFHKKYAAKRYFKSSVYMRNWALDRWGEGTQVDLAKELPTIKAEIKILRETEEAAANQVEDEEAGESMLPALQLRGR
ncbi:G2/mitotic-specific cyclin cdc13 [Psilocybe cubensis]|uniref:G2/mitotic-specific cyclin cdc13 n=2 Tax=Psilocybe cubensis TaxID=181762 RepID=A0ACB8GQ99_PSICU|nr:G2/mitotic-specific cyclin cdc13 [Psilocybe cubensis]KAH9477831.1 G2/mitotic-specific cyclin cdc13 [Psilocybe cubensis]